MSNKIKIAIIIFILLSIPIGLILVQQKQIFRPKASEGTTPFTPETQTSENTLRGTIVSFDRNTLVLRVNNAEQTLSLKDTNDFQLVSAGNYDQGTSQLTQVTFNHLSPGFEVLVSINPDSKDVLKVIILKRGYEQFKYKKIQ